MILAVDIGYHDGGARCAGVLFETWQSTQPARVIQVARQDVAPYIPGAFYQRELPCIHDVLAQVAEPLTCIIIDGYVTLGADQRAGLGQKLWESLDPPVPVIGVAKTWFDGTPDEAHLLRGQSKAPLYVTAIGMTLDAAKAHIASMAGPFRIPAMLKLVDQASRGSLQNDPPVLANST